MFVRLGLIGVIWLTVSACTISTDEPRAAAPIVDKTVVDCSKSYRVREGDKLFLLAWQCHINVDILADMNGISASKPLTVGQVLTLSAVNNASNANKEKTTQNAQAKSTQKSNSNTAEQTKQQLPPPSAGKWVMPVTAKIRKPFSKQHTGIEFATKTGQSVRAVFDGEVVYSGSKLMSYGSMIIIKHPNRYYSAYTKNSQVNVKEGDKVTAGMTIGLTGNEPFYFEFRRNTEHVNFIQLIK